MQMLILIIMFGSPMGSKPSTSNQIWQWPTMLIQVSLSETKTVWTSTTQLVVILTHIIITQMTISMIKRKRISTGRFRIILTKIAPGILIIDLCPKIFHHQETYKSKIMTQLILHSHHLTLPAATRIVQPPAIPVITIIILPMNPTWNTLMSQWMTVISPKWVPPIILKLTPSMEIVLMGLISTSMLSGISTKNTLIIQIIQLRHMN